MRANADAHIDPSQAATLDTGATILHPTTDLHPIAAIAAAERGRLSWVDCCRPHLRPPRSAIGAQQSTRRWSSGVGSAPIPDLPARRPERKADTRLAARSGIECPVITVADTGTFEFEAASGSTPN